MLIASSADLLQLETALTTLLRPSSAAFERTDPLTLHSAAYTRFRCAALRHLTCQPSGLARGDRFPVADATLCVDEAAPDLVVRIEIRGPDI
jgi:hypothetical protein